MAGVEADNPSQRTIGNLAAGRGTRGRVGGAAAELIEAADIVDFGARWMTRNL